MSDSYHDLLISSLRGGRNGFDPPHAIGENQATELLNVDLYRGATLGRKRPGASTDVVTFSAGGPFTGAISFLGRHVPGTDETAAELWAIDDAATPIVGRKAASTQYAAVTLKDAITGNAWDVNGASMNGKFFLAYKSAQDRLHCWDSLAASVRRTGLAPHAAAPTVANTGGGAYAATLRYYRTRSTEQQTGITVRRSEPSASVSFTPSGGGTAARVTRPTAVNELETHWEVEASTDNISFFLLSTIVIGTTTYDDSALIATYSTGTVSAAAGTYTVQKGYKFVAVDQNRLLGFGSHTSTDKQNRIEFSSVVGSLNVGDAERVPTNNYIDLDETDSGFATGLVGPMNMAYYAFKYRQVWRLTPTGDPTTPYVARAITKKVGAVSHHSIVVAEDENGNPAIYWMSHKGPYRYGANGLENLTNKGGNVRDLILGPTKTFNLSAINVVSHAVYHGDLQQVWFWFATGSGNDPDQKIVWDVEAGAWTRADGESAKARCSVMFSNTIGTSMSRDLKPYIGYVSSSVEGFIVGGGGGGGGWGGGGGGGVRYSASIPVTVGSYAVTVGAGGAGSVGGLAQGTSGSDSVFNGVTGHGGGGGGANNGSTFQFLGSISAKSTDGLSVTTAALNTTGADLLVMVVANGGSASAVFDSESNAWTSRTLVTGSEGVQIVYSNATSVGAGHTFTCTNTVASICVLAFSGSKASGAFDVENGATSASATTLQAGNIVPTVDGELVIAGMATADTGTPAINLGYTLAEHQPFVSSLDYGSAAAYLIQTAAGATNPTWTQGLASIAATIASFKSSSLATTAGRDGGSGGGGGSNLSHSGGVGNTGNFATPEGTNGGNGSSGLVGTVAGGGGGGATTSGYAANMGIGGKGGDGFVSSISGAATTYAAGGDGGSDVSIGAVAGAANTGNGGGGGNNSSGAAGGSGIVIIRHRSDVSATGGTITIADGITTHTFTASGTLTVTAVTLGTAVWKCDSTATDDAGTPFQAYAKTRQMAPWGLGNNGSFQPSLLMATAQDGVTITQTITPDFDLTRSSTAQALLTPANGESRVLVKFDAAQAQGVGIAQYQWGDAGPVSNSWQLDAVPLQWKKQEGR